MTDEQINIAIAESLGWHSKSGANGGVKWVDKDGIGRNGGGLYGYGYNDELKLSHLPDYTADLNACREFEKALNTDDAHSYYWRLERELGWEYASATARQRCEAYLRTLNLFVD